MSLSISVIIPAYNAEKTLKECLNSVVSAIGENDEIIVVDDASVDSTVAITQSYKCHLIKLLENQGAANARNEGAYSAKKDLFLFVDSDVLITKENVDNIRKYFERFKSCHTVTLNVNPDLKHDGFFSSYKNLYMNYIISMGRDDVNYVYGSCCATRASGYIPWPLNLKLTEDSLWGYLQKSQGHNIHCLKEIKVTHLKEYGLKSLVRNDFLIASYFARAFWGFKRWNTLYTQESFGHTSKIQILSLLMAVAALFMVFVMPEVVPFILVSWFMLNKDFFFFLKDKKGSFFFLLAIAWTFVDHWIYFAGICRGSIQSIGEKEKVFESEMT